MSTDHFFTEDYPYNARPMFRTPNPRGVPDLDLRCPPDPSLQSIIFEGPNLVVIRGWEWKTKMELNDFFVPVKSYTESEISLMPVQSNSNEFVTISFSTLNTSNNKGNFIAIFPLYHQLDNLNQNQWDLKYRYVGDENWKYLGKILILSTNGNYIDDIELQNSIVGEPLNIRILIGGQ